MAISEILGSVLQAALTQNTQSKFKQFKQEFQQLGQDLQSGNIAQAQSDLVTLQQNSPSVLRSTAAISATASGNPIAQLFSQLGQALQTGNLSSAQQAYSTLQQDFQQFASSSGLGGVSKVASQIATGVLNLVA
jgi:outer membrane protein assembly factor BamD (BamD/ComL family)